MLLCVALSRVVSHTGAVRWAKIPGGQDGMPASLDSVTEQPGSAASFFFHLMIPMYIVFVGVSHGWCGPCLRLQSR